MSDIKTIFADEVRRLSRKEIKVATSSFAGQIQTLKKEIAELSRELKKLKKEEEDLKKVSEMFCSAGFPHGNGSEESHSESPAHPKQFRVSGARLAKIRKKLGLTQAEFAAILNVTTLTVSNWERGKNKIRQCQKKAIAELSRMSRNDLNAFLAEKLPAHKIDKPHGIRLHHRKEKDSSIQAFPEEEIEPDTENEIHEVSVSAV